MLEDRDYMRDDYDDGPGGLRELSGVSILLGINVAVFLFQILASTPGRKMVNEWFFDYLAVSYASVVLKLYVWTPISYMFTHATIGHILFNMLALWVFGKPVEQRIGKARLFWLYGVAGLFAALVHLGLSGASQHVGFLARFGNDGMVGASGSVMGLLIAAALYYPRMPIVLLVIPMQLWKLATGYAILSVLLLLGDTSSNVAHHAHLAGLVAGALFVYLVTGRQGGEGIRQVRPPVRSRARVRNAGSEARGGGEKAGDPLDEIDPILDKIGKHGMKSLTRREREILERAGRQWKQDRP